MEVSGQPRPSAPLTSKNELPVPTEYEAGWAPQTVWTLWSVEKSLGPAWNRIAISRFSSP